MPTRSRVSAGLRFSKVSPVEASTHSPSMKFLKTRTWLSLSCAGVWKVSVAINPPCENPMKAQTLMLQPAQKEGQGRRVFAEFFSAFCRHFLRARVCEGRVSMTDG